MIHRGVSRARRRLILTAGVALAAALCSFLIFAYNPEQDDVNNVPVATRWPNNSFTWSLNPTTGTNVLAGSDVKTALKNALNTWQSAQLISQAVVQLTITEGADTTLTNTDAPSVDCVNIVSFKDSNTKDFSTGTVAFSAVSTARGTPPNNTYTCGSSPTVISCPLQSCIIDADVLFNPAQTFSTATPTPSMAFDVQSVATHEMGHSLGLDHSGISGAVMYPFGDQGVGQTRTLAVDDAAGMAFLYPTSTFPTLTGTISGQVTLSGSGIFASHVIAIDTTTGDAVIDGLTDLSGNYKLIGVPPGTYNVLALPLAPDSNSGVYTLTDFGGWACGFAGLAENSPPCCDATTNPTTCTGKALSNPTNYTGKYF